MKNTFSLKNSTPKNLFLFHNFLWHSASRVLSAKHGIDFHFAHGRFVFRCTSSVFSATAARHLVMLIFCFFGRCACDAAHGLWFVHMHSLPPSPMYYPGGCGWVESLGLYTQHTLTDKSNSLSLRILLNFSMSVEFKIDVNAPLQHTASYTYRTHNTPSWSNLNRCRRQKGRQYTNTLAQTRTHTHPVDTRSSIQSEGCHCILMVGTTRCRRIELWAGAGTRTNLPQHLFWPTYDITMPLFVPSTVDVHTHTHTHTATDIEHLKFDNKIHNNLLFRERRSTKFESLSPASANGAPPSLPAGKSHFDANEIPAAIELGTSQRVRA